MGAPAPSSRLPLAACPAEALAKGGGAIAGRATLRSLSDGDGDVNTPSLALRCDYGYEMRRVDVPVFGSGSALLTKYIP